MFDGIRAVCKRAAELWEVLRPCRSAQLFFCPVNVVPTLSTNCRHLCVIRAKISGYRRVPCYNYCGLDLFSLETVAQAGNVLPQFPFPLLKSL